MSKENQKQQLSLNIEPEQGSLKRGLYNMLMLHYPQDSAEGCTVEQAMRYLKFKGTRRQMQKALNDLVFNGHAVAKTVASKRRYFLGNTPYYSNRIKNLGEIVLTALKKLSASKKQKGYTNEEIHQFILATTSTELTISSVCRATSRIAKNEHIIVTREKGARGQRVFRFLWTANPSKTKKPSDSQETTPPPKEDTPVKTPNPLYPKLAAMYEDARTIIGRGFIEGKLPLTARDEAFAFLDAFRNLRNKLAN